MKRHASILLSLMFLGSCGESPTGGQTRAPDKNLVGSWVFDDTDVTDIMIAGLRTQRGKELFREYLRFQIDEEYMREHTSKYLRDQGVDRATIDEIIDEMINQIGIDEIINQVIDEMINNRDEWHAAWMAELRFRPTIRFNADGSWEDNSGESGTWRVEGNSLISVEDGDEEIIKYFVDGDDLTLIFSSESFLETGRNDEDLTNEEVALFRFLEAVLDEDTNIRLFYKRK